MKYVYVIQCSVPIEEIRKKLSEINESVFVDYTHDVLFLDSVDENILLKSKYGARKTQLLPIAHQNIDFYRLKNRACPLCESRLSMDNSFNRTCECGFNWNGSIMWVEKE